MAQILLRAAPNRPNRSIPVPGRKPLQVSASSSKLLDEVEAAAVEAWQLAHPAAAKDYVLVPQKPRERPQPAPAVEAPTPKRPRKRGPA